MFHPQPSVPSPLPAAKWARVALAALVGVVALNFAAVTVRAWFVANSGPYAATTGFEEFCLYNIWKAAHGFPIYEWPQRDHYLLSFYNGGFYHAYAAWARLWHADGPQLVACVRLLSPLFAAAGMWIQVGLLRRVVASRTTSVEAWIWGLSFLTWFGTAFNAWTVVSARPDVAAAAGALGGFALALRAQESNQRWLWVASSLTFFAGWSFKQSTVWIFAGTMMHLAGARIGWGAWLRLVAPFGLLAGAALVGGGAEYRYNLSEVPRIFGWVPLQSVALIAQVMALNLFFFVFAGWGWLRSWREGRTIAVRERALAVAALPPLAMGVVQLALRGSSTNNMIEGFVMTAVLGSATWLRLVVVVPDWRHFLAGSALLAVMAPLPAAQLAGAARGEAQVTCWGVGVGNLIKLNADQLEQRRDFSTWLAGLPKPLWTRDAMFELPWFATDGKYPAFVLNHQFETDAKYERVFEGAGFADWILKRHFACLLLDQDDPLLKIARRAGYVEMPIPAKFDPLAGEFGGPGRAPRLVVRPPSPHQ